MLHMLPFKPRTWALAALLALAGAAAAAWGYHRARVAELHALMNEQARAYWHERQASAQAQSRQLLHWQRQAQTARTVHHAQLQSLRSAELRTRAELERLRQSLNEHAAAATAASEHSSTAAAGPAADAHGPLLEQCAQQLVELAAAAEGHSTDVRNLLAHWPADAPGAAP